MRFVVDDEDILHAHEIRHDPLQHLAFGFLGIEFLASATLQQQAPALGKLDALAAFEGVVIGDDDLGALDFAEHVRRYELAAGVVTVRIVGLEHAQAITDGEARCHDQESARELLAVRMARGIDGLPGDQHCHHRGLAGTGGELECKA